MAMGAWKQALDDANEVHHYFPCRPISLTDHQVTMLDPSSPWGYEMKHAALHNAGDYDNAIAAFETMLSKMSQSPHRDIQRELYHY